MDLQAIIEIRDHAYQAWSDAEAGSAIEGQHECLYDVAYATYSAMYDALRSDPTIEREWLIRADGVDFDTLKSPAGAPLRAALRDLDTSCYDTSTGPVWVDYYARCEATDETERVTVQLDQDEPDCNHEDGHAWEETGLQGHGGGVIVTETCAHCGCRQTTDTWGQRPDTGEQGFTVVTYDGGNTPEDDY